MNNEDKDNRPGALDVSIGLLARDGRLLITRRFAHVPLGGLWELPGGKQLPGETAAQCLVREMYEELAIVVEPLAAWTPLEHAYPSGIIRLHPFVCRLLSGQPAPLAAAEMAWIAAGQLADYRFPPATQSLLPEIARWLNCRQSY